MPTAGAQRLRDRELRRRQLRRDAERPAAGRLRPPVPIAQPRTSCVARSRRVLARLGQLRECLIESDATDVTRVRAVARSEPAPPARSLARDGRRHRGPLASARGDAPTVRATPQRPSASLCTVATLSATRSRANPGGIADVLSVLGPEVQPHRGRKPPWFKVPAPGGPRYRELQKLIEAENLHTVCQEAACPNIGECWQRGTATFMILGDTCTRRCGFCNVKTGKPTWNDPLEPARVARSVARMGLRHAVITSVDRDDLPDYGAAAFVGVIRQIRRQAPRCKIEVLTPDFRGEEMPLAKVIAERPDVFNHNVEVVPRLYPVARRGSKFERSCRVLSNAKEMGGDEVVDQVRPDGRARRDLRGDGRRARDAARAPRPGADRRPVPAPDRAATCRSSATGIPTSSRSSRRPPTRSGFEHVAAGPLVRSSYHADQHVAQDEPGRRRRWPRGGGGMSRRAGRGLASPRRRVLLASPPLCSPPRARPGRRRRRLGGFGGGASAAAAGRGVYVLGPASHPRRDRRPRARRADPDR